MVRTFIAVEMSPKVRGKLADDIALLKSRAPLVSWVKPDNLHLTLRFLGDVKENDLEELFEALREEVEAFPPFSLEIKGIGAFPNWRHPRVVWAGCGAGADEAVELAEGIEEMCVDLGYERERRPFRPHFTLGRVKQPADAMGLEEAVSGMDGKLFGYLEVDAVVVFMSNLRRTGPVYSPMARIPLEG